MSLTTPIRGRPMSSTDMSNESPLPTPPQAMHDLLRNGKVAAAAAAALAARSSLQGYQELKEESPSTSSVTTTYRHSSSPSARAAASSISSRGTMRASGSDRSPSSLAVSLGAALPNYNTHHRNALGSQMGILQSSMAQNSELVSANGLGEMSLKPLRPGGLTSSSQRSLSYDVSGTPKRVNEEGMKMSTRPSYMSLAASVSSAPNQVIGSRDSNKENAMDSRGSNLSSMGHQRRISAVRRISSRRSPSPTATNGDAIQSNEGGNYRRSSAENEKRQASLVSSRTLLKRSTEEGAAATRRRAVDESQNHSPRHDKPEEHPHCDDEGAGSVPGMSQYVTPGLTSAARVLRSGHASKQAAAPWSVGRSIKRIDRHHVPDKPPQRIVASQEEEEEEDEEEEQKFTLTESKVGEQREVEPRIRWRDIDRGRLGVTEEDEELHEILGTEGGVEGPTTSTREWQGSGSDGSNRSPPIQVPLGADEDEEEDDYVQDGHRSSRAEQYSSAARRSGPIREVESAPRRTAMHDILAAKIPNVVSKRAIVEGGVALPPNLGLPAVVSSSTVTPVILCSSEKEVKVDFMTQVRLEAARQRGREHLERLGNKPSKDLETKFNGYKFKKIRKAGEGGFSTVWQVRGPFAAPDPQQPGSYIEVPESEQAYFAMKQVTLKKMEKISREEVLEECNLLQSLAGKRNNEDFILRFFGWKSSTGSLKILLELGEHDFNHILREGRLSRQQIMQYWHQMLEAVHFTHEEGNIVHTDLKPANFLMANGRLKLIDFGIAQKIPVGTIHIKRDAMIGTPNYMAPETVKAVREAKKKVDGGGGRSDARVYKAGKASDVWALGCIFYQMVYNRPPFEAFHGDDKLKEILDPKHVIQYPLYRPAPPSSVAAAREDGDDDDDHDEHHQQQQRGDEMEMEKVDENMKHVMYLTFIYDPQERVTIPQLLDHSFLRSLVQDRDREDDETVPISRATLKEILRKIYAFTRSGELHEDDLDERGDTLFDNIRDKHHLAD